MKMILLVAAKKHCQNVILTGKDHIKGHYRPCPGDFDSMKKVHGMGDRERLLLQIAVQLHDCGKYISMGDVAECSYQIIMATEIIGLSTEERQIMQMRCATIPQNLFITARSQERSEWIVPYIF